MDFKTRFEGRTTKITKEGDLDGTISQMPGDKSAVSHVSNPHSHISPKRSIQGSPQQLFSQATASSRVQADSGRLQKSFTNIKQRPSAQESLQGSIAKQKSLKSKFQIRQFDYATPQNDYSDPQPTVGRHLAEAVPSETTHSRFNSHRKRMSQPTSQFELRQPMGSEPQNVTGTFNRSQIPDNGFHFTEQSDMQPSSDFKTSNIYMSSANNMADAIKQSQASQVGLSESGGLSQTTASLYQNLQASYPKGLYNGKPMSIAMRMKQNREALIDNSLSIPNSQLQLSDPMANSYHHVGRVGDQPIRFNQDIAHVNNSFHNPPGSQVVSPVMELQAIMHGRNQTETNASLSKRSKSGISQRFDPQVEMFQIESPMKSKRAVGVLKNSRERERHDNLTKISQQIMSSPEPTQQKQLASKFSISKRPAHSGPGLNLDQASFPLITYGNGPQGPPNLETIVVQKCDTGNMARRPSILQSKSPTPSNFRNAATIQPTHNSHPMDGRRDKSVDRVRPTRYLPLSFN